MRVLFDQGTPRPLRGCLPSCEVTTAFEAGWSQFSNGDLLSAAETAGFELLVTTDQNLVYQQNLKTRRIAVIVLSTTKWPRIETSVALVVGAVSRACAGSYEEVDIP